VRASRDSASGIARTISTQEGRDTLVQMAQVWLRLAEKQDAAI
jgi:hypothetical protein